MGKHIAGRTSAGQSEVSAARRPVAASKYDQMRRRACRGSVGPSAGSFLVSDPGTVQLPDSAPTQPLQNETSMTAPATPARATPARAKATSLIKRTAPPARPVANVAPPRPLASVAPAALAAVAFFKGIPSIAIASAVGLPVASIDAYLNGKAAALRATMVPLLAEVLGVDLQQGRLKAGQVHIFDLAAMPFFSTRSTFLAKLTALGSLLGETSAVALDFPCYGGVKRVLTRPVHVVQSNSVRAVFLGARRGCYRAIFDPAELTNCKWALKSPEASRARVFQQEIALRLLSADLTPVEFDEAFQGRAALSWSDVEGTARAYQVTKAELVAWMEARCPERKSTKALAAPKSPAQGAA